MTNPGFIQSPLFAAETEQVMFAINRDNADVSASDELWAARELHEMLEFDARPGDWGYWI